MACKHSLMFPGVHITFLFLGVPAVQSRDPLFFPFQRLNLSFLPGLEQQLPHLGDLGGGLGDYLPLK